jgi:aspartate kinase
MALIVQKYGGTSVGTRGAHPGGGRKGAYRRQGGHEVVVVVSAMSGETNRLLAWPRPDQSKPDAASWTCCWPPASR